MTKETPMVSDLLASLSGGGKEGDGEILDIASKYALQLTPPQIQTLMKLMMFGLDNEEKYPQIKRRIDGFIERYLEMKHFHESGFFIRSIIADLSLKRVIPNDAVKLNVMK